METGLKFIMIAKKKFGVMRMENYHLLAIR